MNIAGVPINASDVLATLAILVSIVVYFQNRRIVSANVSMAESNRTMARTNEAMAQAAEVSAQAAQQAVDLQLSELKESRTANVVCRMQNEQGSAIPYARLGEKGTLGLRIANEGPAAARDVALHVTLPSGETRSSSPVTRLEPDKELSPSPAVMVYPHDFGDGTTRTFGYRVAFRDGNGARAFGFRIWLEGTWEQPGDWKTFKEPAREPVITT